MRNRIGELARGKGVKFNYLAEKCKVSNQTFSRWVKNETQPDLFQAAIIAGELRVSIEDLIESK